MYTVVQKTGQNLTFYSAIIIQDMCSKQVLVVINCEFCQ